ncbi:MAG: hypothetical protein HYS22_03405 [Deltaproteobacteria bacterium]|nr:hypothetical protein [Deltaproteobacteria bacterium]
MADYCGPVAPKPVFPEPVLACLPEEPLFRSDDLQSIEPLPDSYRQAAISPALGGAPLVAVGKKMKSLWSGVAGFGRKIGHGFASPVSGPTSRLLGYGALFYGAPGQIEDFCGIDQENNLAWVADRGVWWLGGADLLARGEKSVLARAGRFLGAPLVRRLPAAAASRVGAVGRYGGNTVGRLFLVEGAALLVNAAWESQSPLGEVYTPAIDEHVYRSQQAWLSDHLFWSWQKPILWFAHRAIPSVHDGLFNHRGKPELYQYARLEDTLLRIGTMVQVVLLDLADRATIYSPDPPAPADLLDRPEALEKLFTELDSDLRSWVISLWKAENPWVPEAAPHPDIVGEVRRIFDYQEEERRVGGETKKFGQLVVKDKVRFAAWVRRLPTLSAETVIVPRERFEEAGIPLAPAEVFPPLVSVEGLPPKKKWDALSFGEIHALAQWADGVRRNRPEIEELSRKITVGERTGVASLQGQHEKEAIAYAAAAMILSSFQASSRIPGGISAWGVDPFNIGASGSSWVEAVEAYVRDVLREDPSSEGCFTQGWRVRYPLFAGSAWKKEFDPFSGGESLPRGQFFVPSPIGWSLTDPRRAEKDYEIFLVPGGERGNLFAHSALFLAGLGPSEPLEESLENLSEDFKKRSRSAVHRSVTDQIIRIGLNLEEDAAGLLEQREASSQEEAGYQAFRRQVERPLAISQGSGQVFEEGPDQGALFLTHLRALVTFAAREGIETGSLGDWIDRYTGEVVPRLAPLVALYSGITESAATPGIYDQEIFGGKPLSPEELLQEEFATWFLLNSPEGANNGLWLMERLEEIRPYAIDSMEANRVVKSLGRWEEVTLTAWVVLEFEKMGVSTSVPLTDTGIPEEVLTRLEAVEKTPTGSWRLREGHPRVREARAFVERIRHDFALVEKALLPDAEKAGFKTVPEAYSSLMRPQLVLVEARSDQVDKRLFLLLNRYLALSNIVHGLAIPETGK